VPWQTKRFTYFSNVPSGTISKDEPAFNFTAVIWSWDTWKTSLPGPDLFVESPIRQLGKAVAVPSAFAGTQFRVDAFMKYPTNYFRNKSIQQTALANICTVGRTSSLIMSKVTKQIEGVKDHHIIRLFSESARANSPTHHLLYTKCIICRFKIYIIYINFDS
jgi:hypothetical protein